MSSRIGIQQIVSTTQPVDAAVGDEWFNPSTGKLYKNIALGGTQVGFLEIPLASQPVNITNTSNSVSTATGALSVQGGVGVAGNLYVGGTIYGSISGSITSANQVATQAQPASATYYPAFVNANNSSATPSSIYTTSSFTVNPATGFATIGTATPIGNVALTVVGGGVHAPAIVANGNPDSYADTGGTMMSYANGVGSIRVYSNTGGTGATSINFITSGTAQMTLNSFGQLGVGTTSPANLLDVSSTGTNYGVNITKANSGFANQNGGALNFYNYGPIGSGRNAGTLIGQIYFGASQPVNGAIQDAAAIKIIAENQSGVNTPSAMAFFTSVPSSGGVNAEAMRIDASGNVNITTTTNYSGAKLSVNGGAYINGTFTATTIIENGYAVVSQRDIGSAPNQIPLNQYLGSMAYQDQTAISVGTVNFTGVLGVGTATNYGTAGQVLQSNGSSSSPSWVSTVSLAITATQINTVIQTANASYYPTFVSTNNASASGMSEYTTSSFTINPSNGALTIGGGLYLANNANYIYSYNAAQSANTRMLGINASNVAYLGPIDGVAVSTIWNAASTSLYNAFYAGGAEKVRIDSTGALSVGYTAAQSGALLSVNGSAYINGVVTATTFAGTATSAQQIQTTAQVDSVNPYYLTFVNANNASATAGALYTSSTVIVRPGTGQVSILGTTSTATNKLQLGQSINGGTFTGTTHLRIIGNANTATQDIFINLVRDRNPGIQFAGAAAMTLGSYITPTVATAPGSRLSFYLKNTSDNSDVANVQVMSLLDTGYVGVGYQIPVGGELFGVNGGGYFNGIVTATTYYGTFAGTIGSGVTLSTATNAATAYSTIGVHSTGTGLFGGSFNGSAPVTWSLNTATLMLSAVSAGSVANALTINNSGSGASSGQTFNGSSPVTISFNTIGATQAPTSAYNGVISADTRAVADTPISRNAGLYVDFKQNTTDGLADSGTYHGVLTFRAYGSGNDQSGGQTAQIAYTDGNNIWHRLSTNTSTWSSWYKIIDTGNTSTALVASALTATNAAYAYSFNTATLVTYAVNLSGGANGSIPYQNNANSTVFLPISATVGAIQASNGATPYYNNTVTAVVNGVGSATGNTGQSLRVAAGGLGVTGDSYFANNLGIGGTVTFGGQVVFNGTSTYVFSTQTVYTDNIIEMHTPPAGVYTPWFADDGKDIGFRFHYYANSTDTNAALVLANDTKYLEWYSSGAESASGVFTGSTVYGTFRTGGIKLVGGAVNSGNTASGDLQVLGGVGVGNNLYVAGNVTVGGTLSATLTGTASTATNAATAYSTIGVHSTGTGFFGGSFNGSAPVTWSLNTATLMASAVSASNATQVLAQAQPANATYYPTFVNANNASATASSIYTTSSFSINPATGLATLAATNSGNTVEVLRLSNSGAGANTQAQLTFYSPSTIYASIAGGYGATAPQMTFNLPSATTGNYIWQNNSVEQLRINTAGQVGVGSNYAGTGGALLAVNGGGYFNGAVTATTVVINSSNADSNSLVNLPAEIGGAWIRIGNQLNGLGQPNGVGIKLYNTGVAHFSMVSTGTNLIFANTGVQGNQLLPTGFTNLLTLTTAGGVSFGGLTNYGSTGQLLQSNGNAAPTWVPASGVTAGSATTATSAGTAYSTIGVHSTGTGFFGGSFNGSAPVTWSLNTATLMLSAVSAGSVTNALTIGSGLNGTVGTYNGSAAVTVTLNTATLMASAVNLAGGAGGQVAIQSNANATTFISTGSLYVGRAVVADSASGGSAQVNTQAQSASATYYPTFVSTNNASAGAMSVYTTSSFAINPATGFVGVGVSTPPGSLGNASFYSLVGITAVGTATAQPYIHLYNPNAGANLKTWRWGLSDNTGAISFQTINDAYSASTEYLKITATGQVGVGSNYAGTSGALLAVNGGAYINGVVTATGVAYFSSSVSLNEPAPLTYATTGSLVITNTVFRPEIALRTNTAIGSTTALKLGVTSQVPQGGAVISSYTTAVSGQPTDMLFQTLTSGTLNERLRITSNGGFAFNGASNYGSTGQLLQSNGDATPSWVSASGVTAGSATTATSAGTAYSTIGVHSTGTGFFGGSFNGSAPVTWSLNTATLMASAVSAGSVVNSLSTGTGLFGGAYNGSSAQTFSLNTATLMASAVNLAGGAGGQVAIQSNVNATTFISTGSLYVGRAVVADSAAGGSAQVNTVAQTANATYYPTFVSANNASAAAMSVYTTSSFAINPATGFIGIGTVSPGYNLQVNGSFAATTKSFVIDHPTRSGMKLRYGSLEGPENGVYVRGRLTNSNTIQLPDYWVGLVDESSITVDLTPIGKYQKLFVKDIGNNTVVVGNDNLFNNVVNCFYTVWAERKDVAKLVVEISNPK